MRRIVRSRTTLATIDAAAIAALRSSPSTTAMCSGALGPSRKPSTRQASAGGASACRARAQPGEVRAVQPFAVDLRGRDHLDGDLRRAGEHGPEERLPVLGADLLRVVQLRERPNAMVAQRFVVEKNAGDDERPG